jgi:hypothetical protein
LIGRGAQLRQLLRLFGPARHQRRKALDLIGVELGFGLRGAQLGAGLFDPGALFGNGGLRIGFQACAMATCADACAVLAL